MARRVIIATQKMLRAALQRAHNGACVGEKCPPWMKPLCMGCTVPWYLSAASMYWPSLEPHELDIARCSYAIIIARCSYAIIIFALSLPLVVGHFWILVHLKAHCGEAEF